MRLGIRGRIGLQIDQRSGKDPTDKLYQVTRCTRTTGDRPRKHVASSIITPACKKNIHSPPEMGVILDALRKSHGFSHETVSKWQLFRAQPDRAVFVRMREQQPSFTSSCTLSMSSKNRCSQWFCGASTIQTMEDHGSSLGEAQSGELPLRLADFSRRRIRGDFRWAVVFSESMLPSDWVDTTKTCSLR